MMTRIYRPTTVTICALTATVASIAGTAGFIIGRLPLLRRFLPVHFDTDGLPDRWMPATYSRVLLPVWIQLALAIVFGAVTAILLYRTHPFRSGDGEDDAVRRERERMLVTAEAMSLMTAIWVMFQGIAAIRIARVWQFWLGDLGSIYMQSLAVAIVLSVIVAIRASVNLRYEGAAAVDLGLNIVRWRAVAFLGLFLIFGLTVPLMVIHLLLE